MTGKGSASKDKKAGQARRDKDHDSEGRPYEFRDGLWTEIDHAVRDFGILMDTWFLLAILEIELEILNPPGKLGRKRIYTPCTVLIMLFRRARGESYRDVASHVYHTGDDVRLRVPSYSRLHVLEEEYFGPGGNGWKIIREALRIAEERGIEVKLDPDTLASTDSMPEYEAPQLKVTSGAEQREQDARDAEAAEMRESMRTMVFSRMDDGRWHTLLVDGSGIGTTGPGIYREKVWLHCDRRFVKIHVAIDADTHEVVAFAVTPETPGDARMLAPLMEGILESGVEVLRVCADSAYDSTDNWTMAADGGFVFMPNLKERFGWNRELEDRNRQLGLEEELGKKDHHRMSGYNVRWLIEVFFSVLKKLFGEKVSNRRFDRMALSIGWRMRLYNIRRSMIDAAIRGCRIGHPSSGRRGVSGPRGISKHSLSAPYYT